jgi:hypothetical protein
VGAVPQEVIVGSSEGSVERGRGFSGVVGKFFEGDGVWKTRKGWESLDVGLLIGMKRLEVEYY